MEETIEPTPEPKAGTVIDTANAAADRLENAVKAMTIQEDRIQERIAKQALQGVTEAGNQPVPKTAEETKKDNAKEYFKGTELETAINKYNE